MGRFHHVLAESSNGVKTITMNRPEKRNALCPLLIEELTVALHEAETCECRVVILTGAGPAFCSGLDMEHLETLKASTPEEHRRDSENMARVLRTLYDFPKPIIAAVNGPAIAGGMALATIPDFTLASPAAKFGYTEVRVGFAPTIVASFLVRQVGELRTRELLLSGRILKAQEALAQCLLQNSPQAMMAVKQILAKHAKRRLDEEIEDAIEMNSHQKSTEDFKEGILAFKERRKPEWPSLYAKV